MPKFVVHKKAFYYTDEAFTEDSTQKGSLIGVFSSLEEARKNKHKVDISSMQKNAGEQFLDFFFYHKNHQQAFQQLQRFYLQNWAIELQEFDLEDLLIPTTNFQQAEELLNILQLSFHDIVEYPDDVNIEPKDFKLEGDDHVCEF